MPVEIKELVIKTEVTSDVRHPHSSVHPEDLTRLKEEIMNACKRMIHERTKKSNFKR